MPAVRERREAEVSLFLFSVFTLTTGTAEIGKNNSYRTLLQLVRELTSRGRLTRLSGVDFCVVERL